MSRNRTRILALLLAVPALAVLSAGCSDEGQQVQPVVQKPVPRKVAEASVPPAADNAVVAKAAEPSLYNPAGKRDPFVPFIHPPAKDQKAEVAPGTPSILSQDIATFKYVGMVWSPRGVRALVEDFEGKGYTVTVGSRLGRGGAVVTRITDKEIVVREEFKDYTGTTIVRDSPLKLKSAGGK